MTKSARYPGRLLLYVPVDLYRDAEGGLLFEAQALNGLARWAENFSHVTLLAPLQPGPAPAGWNPIADLGLGAERIEICPIPSAWSPWAFLRALPRVARIMAARIDRADRLCFAIGGFFGDWGAVACLIASRRGRAYAVWTDRVESDVVWRMRREGGLKRYLWYHFLPFPMRMLERAVIRRATLGLFHGRETFDAYARFCGGTSHVVHDIHIRRSDHISPDALKAKKDSLSAGPLKICYVGRMDAMKGPIDWVDILHLVARAGVEFQAVWLGGGPERAAMEARIAEHGLGDRISLPGFTTDREAVLDQLRASHLMLFCHKTPESPRCLIEALISATPILGYDGAFAADLISGHGGGVLVTPDKISVLVDRIRALARNPADLCDLIDRAFADGAPFDDERVFAHRSDLIQRYLSGA